MVYSVQHEELPSHFEPDHLDTNYKVQDFGGLAHQVLSTAQQHQSQC